MGSRKISIRESVVYAIAEISWYIESEGLVATAKKFSDDAYDFISKLTDGRKGYRSCRDPQRNLMGYKCISYRKKYTIVLIELDDEIIVCEFIPSKLIYW